MGKDKAHSADGLLDIIFKDEELLLTKYQGKMWNEDIGRSNPKKVK